MKKILVALLFAPLPVADLPKYQTTMTQIEQATGMRFNLGK
jgi:hypothetical protein